jgi:hypothetical protein
MSQDDTSIEPRSMIERSASLSSQRAQDMRASYSLRREAETLLGEASQLRRRAADEADEIVAEAETLSNEMLAEARAEGEQLVRQAQERADGLIARATDEADRIRSTVEREQLRSTAALEEADRLLGSLAPALEESAVTVASLRETVRELRGGGGQVVIAGVVRMPQGPQDVAVAVVEDEPSEPAPGITPTGPEDPRPLGWLFRTSQG